MNINPLHSNRRVDDDMDINIRDNKYSKNRKKVIEIKPLSILMVVALVMALAAAGYFFYQNTQLKSKVDNPTQALDEQSKEIKENVSKIFDLGNIDDYSVASITNVDNLKKENPDFYKNAKNGDYLIVSQQRAILYNKEKNMVLNVAPIINNPTDTSNTAPQSTSTPVPTATSTPTVTPKR